MPPGMLLSEVNIDPPPRYNGERFLRICTDWKICFRLPRATYTRPEHRHVYKVRHLGGDADRAEVRMYL